MENALAQIKKDRDSLVKENESLQRKIDDSLERVERYQQGIYDNEKLIAEYDQIIEKVKGVKENV